MPDEIKYIIIKGKGEKEEKELKPLKEVSIKKEKIEPIETPEKLPPTFEIKKEEPIPEKVPELKPSEIPQPSEEALLKVASQEEKREYKIPSLKIPAIKVAPSWEKRKKIPSVLIFIILIPFIIYGGYFVLKKFNVVSKIPQKEEPREEKKEEEKIITSIFPKTTPTEATVTQPGITISTASTEVAEPTITASTHAETSTSQLIPTSSEPTSTQLTSSIISTSSTPTSATSNLSVATKTKTENVSKIEEEKLEAPSPKSEEIKEVKIENIEKQGTKAIFPFLKVPEINIALDELTTNDFRIKWLNLMKIQKNAGSLYKVNFLYGNQVLPGEFIKNYFLNPSFIEKKYQESFQNSLGDYCLILIYYTYTRKFPVIIFTIKNDEVVVPFMRLWDKESLLNDFKNLYLGLPQGKLIRFYTITEDYEGIKYKIAYYNNDYKFIWTIYNDNLIISTSLTAFKYIIKNLK